MHDISEIYLQKTEVDKVGVEKLLLKAAGQGTKLRAIAKLALKDSKFATMTSTTEVETLNKIAPHVQLSVFERFYETRLCVSNLTYMSLNKCSCCMRN